MGNDGSGYAGYHLAKEGTAGSLEVPRILLAASVCTMLVAMDSPALPADAAAGKIRRPDRALSILDEYLGGAA